MAGHFAHPRIQGMTSCLPLENVEQNLDELSKYSPDDRAVLMFIERNNGGDRELLLIEKKRGLGAGKVNAPGGKLEEGETFVQAAVRECQEEVGLTALDPQLMGRLYFTFADGYRMYGEVFLSKEYQGSEYETDEALPFWCPVNSIPYSRMWDDDRLWLPHILTGQLFSAYFFFDGDRLDHAQLIMDFSQGKPALP